MKKCLAFVLAAIMLLSVLPLGVVSAAAAKPEVVSHEEKEEVIAEKTLNIKFEKVKNADHYYCRIKVLKGKPDGSTDEKALRYYDFEYDGVTGNKIKLYGYDLEEDTAGHYMKIYIEARSKDRKYISSSVRYLFIRKDASAFASPWTFGLLPMKTVKKGASGNEIKALCQAINIVLGEDRLKITSKFDGEVEKALKEVQGKLGLETDGVFGPASRKALLRYLEQNGHVMENREYNASDALAYAEKYNGRHSGSSYNKQYPSFAGNDCANFVSQCLIAGGFAITADFNPDLSSWKCCRYSPSTKTKGLMDYLSSLGFKVYGYDSFTKNGASSSYPIDIDKIQPGDVIFSKGSNGTISGHAMLVDHVEGNKVFFYAHTNDRCPCSECGNYISVSKITSHIALSE